MGLHNVLKHPYHILAPHQVRYRFCIASVSVPYPFRVCSVSDPHRFRIFCASAPYRISTACVSVQGWVRIGSVSDLFRLVPVSVAYRLHVCVGTLGPHCRLGGATSGSNGNSLDRCGDLYVDALYDLYLPWATVRPTVHQHRPAAYNRCPVPTVCQQL